MLASRRSLALALALCACTPPTSSSPRREVAGTEILWDTYGVPHIYAPSRRGLAFAFGWAQMRNHGDLLLRLVAQARGRAAEYLGADYLAEDRWVWMLDMPARARRWLDMQPPEMRAHVEAFVAGINAFASAHPELVSDSVRAVLPVRAVDVFAHLQRVEYSHFITSREGVSRDAQRWAERGSNAWAIAPRRSASGNTLLLANPHLPWSDLFTWMEAQYAAPGIDVYGAALVLSPVLQIAFNDRLGWTHTVNTQDGEDPYELTLSGDGYLWDGQVRPFERAEHVLRVRELNGTFRHDTVRVRRSVHGPVVAEKPGFAVALAVVGMHGPDLPFVFEQWWQMGRARNFDEFLAAIRPNQISGQNITYGDRDGHIMMFYGGNTPVRPRGDRAYWAGLIRGDTSATLWTRLHGFDEMPKTVDPPSGYVQNANDPPWWSTFPPVLRPDRYPSYLAPRGMRLRPQRSIRMLDADSSITYEELLAYKNSTRMELADRVLAELLRAAKVARSEPTGRAAEILERWDRSADSSSRGAVLFAAWWAEYRRRLPHGRGPFAVEWSEDAPLTTPRGLADTAIAVAALEAAVVAVTRRYSVPDVAWGDVHRLRRDAVDLPASGADGEYGVFRVVSYAEQKDGKFAAAGATSYVAAIEFSSPLRAQTLVAYGNVSREGSPHRTDQLPLFASKQLKPVWRTREQVRAHLELREKF